MGGYEKRALYNAGKFFAPFFKCVLTFCDCNNLFLVTCLTLSLCRIHTISRMPLTVLLILWQVISSKPITMGVPTFLSEQVEEVLPALWWGLKVLRNEPLTTMLSRRDSRPHAEVEQAFAKSIGKDMMCYMCFTDALYE